MHNIHPRIGLPLHYSYEDNVLGTLIAPYYGGYLAHVDEYQRYLDGEHGMAEEEAVPESPKATKVTKPKAAMQTKPWAPKATKVTKPVGDKAPKTTSSQPPKLKPTSTKPSKAIPEKKQKLVKETRDEPSPAKRPKGGLVGKRRKPKSQLKLVDEFFDEGVPITEPRIDDEEADFQRGIKLSLKDLEARNQGPARTVVIRELDSRRIQSLPEVQGKGKEKIIDEQTAEPTGPSSQPEDEGITMTNSETESDEIVTPVNKEKDTSNRELTKINAGVQDEGQAGSNPGKQDEGQAGSNPENLKLPTEDQVILKEPASSTGTLSSLQNLEKELTFTDQFFMEKPQEEEPEKTNAESEVQSMVAVPIHQDTSSVPPMTTLVIDLTTSQSDSPTVHALLPTSTATTITITTTTLPPPPPQP
ncbi:hypothetical protein Tco_1421064 [Tanacetum coccineum]